MSSQTKPKVPLCSCPLTEMYRPRINRLSLSKRRAVDSPVFVFHPVPVPRTAATPVVPWPRRLRLRPRCRETVDATVRAARNDRVPYRGGWLPPATWCAPRPVLLWRLRLPNPGHRHARGHLTPCGDNTLRARSVNTCGDNTSQGRFEGARRNALTAWSKPLSSS